MLPLRFCFTYSFIFQLNRKELAGRLILQHAWQGYTEATNRLINHETRLHTLGPDTDLISDPDLRKNMADAKPRRIISAIGLEMIGVSLYLVMNGTDSCW